MEATKQAPAAQSRQRVRIGGSNLTFGIVVLFLLCMGIVMMFSASYAIAINEGKAGYYYALRQVIFAGIGLFMMVVFSVIDYHIFYKNGIAVILFAASVILLGLVPFIGTDLDTGNTRWINLGFTTFQPSELTKFAVVILFAYLIDRNYDKMKRFTTGTLPFFVLLGLIVILLMLEPHLSCSLLIVLLGVTMIYIGGARWWHILLVGVVGAALLAGLVVYLVKVRHITYFETRINCWLHPFDQEYLKDTWQTRQSLIAIGSGGVFGLGLGESRQKYIYLPEAENDFVFAIVCEEPGLIGAITVIVLFVLLVILGFHIANHCKDRFGMLVAVGFTLQIALQALLNIAVVSNLVPNTGISLPFFSYGGTALIMQLAEMGIVLNISRPRELIVSRPIAKNPAPTEPEYRQDA